MDRSSRRSAGLGLAAALAAGAVALAAAPGDPPLRAMRWAPLDADPRRAFATAPTECLRKPADPALALKVEVGRAAFRTPLLLGGQAARVGLACETCHRAGRTNPDFRFPGLSGAPGTADVTNSLFSRTRGDGIDDPRPIPDLSAPKAQLKVSQAPADRQLEGFIRGLVVEEFDGHEPPPAVLAGLAAYVRALDPGACPAAARELVTPASLLADVRRALTAASAEADQGDGPTAVLLIAAARSRLGQIDERYAAPQLAADRGELRAADDRLAAIQQALRDRRGDVRPLLARWLRDSRRLERRLAGDEPASLFDRDRLAQAASARLPR